MPIAFIAWFVVSDPSVPLNLMNGYLYRSRLRTHRNTDLQCGMDSNTLYGPPSATLEILLDDPDEHDFASMQRLLDGLSGEQAVTTPHGLPYSIAAILAHMNSNVQFNLDLIRSDNPVNFANPYENWPTVSVDEWPSLVQAFLSGMAELKRIAQEGEELERTLFPAMNEEPAWTVGYKLVASVAKHNTYHLGQIAVLRRLTGAWVSV